MPSTQQVDMQMMNRLAAIVAAVDHSAKALRESFAACNLSSNPLEMAKQDAVFRRGMRERDDVASRDNQHMHRRLRVDVREGDCLLVLVEKFRGKRAVDDLAE